MKEVRMEVHGRQRKEEWYGYEGLHTVHYQELAQVTRIYGKIVAITVIDTEIVPEDAIIDMGCFGMTEWRSKWATAFPEAFLKRT
jgi:hypothetical protein